MKKIECRKCNSAMKKSKVFVNYHHRQYPFCNSNTEFETKLESCMKCEDCGHSFVINKEKKK